MFDVIRLIATLRTDRRGVTAVEYGIMASLIAVAIIGAVTALGGNLTQTFNSLASHLHTS